MAETRHPQKPVDLTREQHKTHIRRLTARAGDHLRQVLLDLANDRPLVSPARDAAEVVLELHAALTVLAAYDQAAARTRRAAA